MVASLGRSLVEEKSIEFDLVEGQRRHAALG
jgi:hypothetical protein